MVGNIVFLPFLLVVIPTLSEASDVNMNGSSYIRYNMQRTKEKIFGLSETLSLRFKTMHPTGLLFYGHGSTGQYVSLELYHGKLRYTINLVSTGSSKVEPYSLTYGDNLCDNKWHDVRITRDKEKLHLYLDRDQAKIFTIKLPRYQTHYYLVIDSGYYIGGTWKSRNEFAVALAKNFVGCLADVLFNAYHPISAAKRNTTGYEITGRLSYGCPPSTFEPITFTSNMAVLSIPTVAKDRVSASFSFRTYDQDGILLYRDGPKLSVYLYLKEGKLNFDFLVGLGAPLTLDTSKFVRGDLNDGAWHTVKASVDAQFMSVEVDDYLGVNTSAHFDQKFPLAFESITYVGGGIYYRGMHGFVGCMQDLRVNGQTVDLVHLNKPAGMTANLVAKGKCSLTSLCHPSACQYRSSCVQKLNNYTCRCRRFYSGRNCEVPMYQPTCQKYKELGMREDAHCLVDPDNAGPLPEFRVLCNMSADDDAVTIVNHTLGRSMVKVCDATRYSSTRESWIHLIDYGVDRQNLRVLVDKSEHCRQFVQFDCVNTTFFEVADADSFGASWLSTDNQQKYYWGGATKGTGCACAETGTCHDRTKSCNCDTGDAAWRRDSGYITTKADLPVIGIFFPESAKSSYFTLGPLECFGRKKQLTRDVGERKYFDIACQPLVTTPPPIYPWRSRGLEVTDKSLPTAKVTPSAANHSSVEPKLKKSTTDKRKVPVTDGSLGSNITRARNTKISVSPDSVSPVNSTDAAKVDVSSMNKDEDEETSWVFIVIIAGSAALLILLIAFFLVVVRHKRANGVWCTGLFKFSTCGQHQQLPKIEIYRHSMGTDSPDILHMGDFKNSKVIDLHLHRGHFVAKKEKKKKMVTFKDETC